MISADRHASYPVKSYQSDKLSPPTAQIRNIVIPKGDYTDKIQRRIDETDIERKLLPEEAVEESGSLERQVLANYGRIVETTRLIRKQSRSMRYRVNKNGNSLKNRFQLKNQGPIIIDTLTVESVARTLYDLPKANSSVTVGKVIKISTPDKTTDDLGKPLDGKVKVNHSLRKTKTINQVPLRKGQRFKSPTDFVNGIDNTVRSRYQESSARGLKELKSKGNTNFTAKDKFARVVDL